MKEIALTTQETNYVFCTLFKIKLHFTLEMDMEFYSRILSQHSKDKTKEEGSKFQR